MKEDFMTQAIRLATKNVEAGGGPFGAVVVKDGEVIAAAANQVTVQNDPTAHAEVLAIRMACQRLGKFDLEGCELYTSCEPCPMCLGAIYWARLARVYFGSSAGDAAAVGFDDALIYRELERGHAERKIPMIQTMRNEAAAAFRAWKDKTDKVQY